jgi:hypothetical protein
MRTALWTLLALLLTALAIGGFLTGLSGRNGGGIFDIIIGALLAWAAWGVWKHVGAARGPCPDHGDKQERPWRR